MDDVFEEEVITAELILSESITNNIAEKNELELTTNSGNSDKMGAPSPFEYNNRQSNNYINSSFTPTYNSWIQTISATFLKLYTHCNLVLGVELHLMMLYTYCSLNLGVATAFSMLYNLWHAKL